MIEAADRVAIVTGIEVPDTGLYLIEFGNDTENKTVLGRRKTGQIDAYDLQFETNRTRTGATGYFPQDLSDTVTSVV